MGDSVYGIDLGTTYSGIARINDLGQAEIVLNYDSNPTTPSVVYFEGENNIVVGEEAKRVQRSAPDHACSLIKRHMGTSYPQEFHGDRYTPESISALILKELVATANNESGQEIGRAVITVPAYFGVKEKEATRQAGQIAGLDVVGIVTEPVAAALSLGIRGENPETVLVYDLGGGTFDTTVLRAEAGRVEVVAVDGNKTLGGADWDSALAQLIVEKFVRAAGLGDEDPLLDEEFEAELLGQVEETKKSLTKREKATVRCRYGDHDEKVEVTRAEFEEATRHLVGQTLEIAQRTVATAEEKVPGLSVDRVLLVGGSAKMPMVETALRDQLGWDPARSDFDLAVAKGAAVYGQAAVDEVLSTDGSEVEVPKGAEKRYFLGDSRSLSVTNVLSRGLGVQFMDEEKDREYVSFLVHANDAIPAQPAPITAETLVDNQERVAITLCEQGGELESEAPEDNEVLQEKMLPIPPLPKGAPVEITLTVTAEGLARVHAYDPAGDRSIDVEAQVSVLSQDEVAQAVKQVSGLSLRS
ncbi:Hsp70 family protein [Nocardiopsis sp. HNM0947]|uniref:Hsp70 family protein n=1 Tax=Nocardiopsis coralli TaxID=2772213 RepID=A0ABR9P7L7_9ACTN|nr:Hsp70 family protein [Nocardiopsis coralli]MBE2999821.1 Hsp70 family protein [Nocardiopsis coralli]